MSQLRRSSRTSRTLGFEPVSRRSPMSQIGVARGNSGEDLSVYAASRINQLRKSSSAASHIIVVHSGHMGNISNDVGRIKPRRDQSKQTAPDQAAGAPSHKRMRGWRRPWLDVASRNRCPRLSAQSVRSHHIASHHGGVAHQTSLRSHRTMTSHADSLQRGRRVA